MQYLGGKTKVKDKIVPILQSAVDKHGGVYFEPFIGGGSIFCEIQADYKVGSDIHPDLILMWQALQDGWEPPTDISEEQYAELRHNDPSALRGFVGFGCSFGAKWFGGYARNALHRNYARIAHDSLYRKLAKMDMSVCSFAEREYYFTSLFTLPGDVIYCDPPYKGTTEYKNKGFNHDKFWIWVRDMSLFFDIYVSEYQAPDDFVSILDIPTKTSMRDINGEVMQRNERLFVYKEGIHWK